MEASNHKKQVEALAEILMQKWSRKPPRSTVTKQKREKPSNVIGITTGELDTLEAILNNGLALVGWLRKKLEGSANPSGSR